MSDGPVRERLNEIQRGGDPWGAVQMLADEIDCLRWETRDLREMAFGLSERVTEMEARLVSWESMTRHLDKRVTAMEVQPTKEQLCQLRDTLDRSPATAAGESETGSGTTPTCGSTGSDDLENILDGSLYFGEDQQGCWGLYFSVENERAEAFIPLSWLKANWPIGSLSDDRISRLAEVAIEASNYYEEPDGDYRYITNWPDIVRAILEADDRLGK